MNGVCLILGVMDFTRSTHPTTLERIKIYATGNIYRLRILKFNNLLPLKPERMFDEYENKKRKQVRLMRSILDYGMGIAILAAGVIFFFREKFHFRLNEDFPPNDTDKIFGAICIVYGCWRIYRGYKKNYFR